MVENLFRDVTGVAMAIVGVAILYTLVSPRNKTAEVVRATSGGFATALSAAMGGQVSGGGVMGGTF